MLKNLEGEINPKGGPKLRQRSNFAVQHLMAAARFAHLCQRVESENLGKPFGNFYDEILHYVSATILCSVASLEAYVNEIYADCIDGVIQFSIHNQCINNEIWELVRKKPTLDKYQYVLVLNEKPRMDKGTPVYQEAAILIRVRNALVHFKPEWHDAQKEHANLGNNLRGKFPLSPFFPDNEPIFPSRCMSYGFSKWAVEVVIRFIDEFTKEASLRNKISGYYDRLKLE